MNHTYEVIEKAKEYAIRVHNAAGCTYGDDDEGYETHLYMVEDWVSAHQEVFILADDRMNTRAAAFAHDVIEDAQQTYNDVKDATSKPVADITLAVTDVHETNRMLRFLSTIPKILKDHRALVLKVCDIGANSSYGKGRKNGMYKKYQKEWEYKRYIFVTASRWYAPILNLKEFDKLIEDVDKAVGYTP